MCYFQFIMVDLEENIYFCAGLFEAGNLTKGHFVTNLLALQTSGSFVGRVSSKFSPDLAPFTIPNSVQKKKLFDMVIPWVCLASIGHQIALWVCYLLGFKRKHTNVQSQHLISLKHSWIEGFQRNKKIEVYFFSTEIKYISRHYQVSNIHCRIPHLTINILATPSQVAKYLSTRSPEVLESPHLPLCQSIRILTFGITSNPSNHNTTVIIKTAIMKTSQREMNHITYFNLKLIKYYFLIKNILLSGFHYSHS